MVSVRPTPGSRGLRKTQAARNVWHLGKIRLFERFSNMICYAFGRLRMRSKAGGLVGNQRGEGLIRRQLSLRAAAGRASRAPSARLGPHGGRGRRTAGACAPRYQDGGKIGSGSGLSGPPSGSSSAGRSSRRCCGRTSRARRPSRRLRPRGRGRPRARRRGSGASGRPCRTRGRRPSDRP